jgi:hypothetical protein
MRGVLSFDGMCIIACLQDVGTAYVCSCVGKSHTWLFYLLRPVWSIHSEALSPCQGRLAVGPWWVVPALIFPLKPEARQRHIPLELCGHGHDIPDHLRLVASV